MKDFVLAHLQDELNEMNSRLSDMKFMVEVCSERTDRVLDFAQDVLNNNERLLKYIKILENCIGKEESNSVLRKNDI